MYRFSPSVGLPHFFGIRLTQAENRQTETQREGRGFVFSMKASFDMYHIFYENGFWQLEGALPIPVYRIFNAYWFAVLTA